MDRMMGFVKRLLGSRWLKWAVVVVAVGIGAYAIDKEWNQVHHALGEIGLVASLEALLALLVMQYATLRQWQALLAGLGSPVRTTTAGRIFFIGQLGKYIPGSLWPVLTQMELGARANIPRTRSASASILTMILSLATGLLVAAATLPFAHYSAGYDWIFILVPVILVCLYPKVLNPLLNWLFKLIKRPGLDQPVTLRMLSKALAWSLLAWTANGAQIWVLADKLGAPAGRTALIALGGYAFAWCVGFIIVFAPAGAGGRDALLILALSPLIGHQAGLAVALVSRGVNTISDLIVAGAAAASRGRGKSTAEESRVVEESTVEGNTAEGKEPEAVPAEAATATSRSDTGPLG
jgi:glycosyltransferase 2 family protein